MPAQQITRYEFGAGYYGQTSTVSSQTNSRRDLYTGPFARLSFNLNQSVALEAFGFDSIDSLPSGNKVGGHQVLALAGIKAGIRRKHFGVFGRLDAGSASYSRGLELIQVVDGKVSDAPPVFPRETHFALEPGGSFELYFSPRMILRADVDENLNAIFRTINPISSNEFQSLGGYVPHHLAVALSLERRFGSLEDGPALSPEPEHFSVGAYFPLAIREQFVSNNAPALGGGGAWIELPAFRFLSTDIVAFDLPHDDHTAGNQDGGTPFSAFVGPKAGFHLGNFAVFAKSRPGVTRFSRTVFSSTITSDGEQLLGSSVYHPQYQFSLDTGGVLEYTAARHILLRLEAGDDLIFYHSHSVAYSNFGNSGVATVPAMHSSSLLFLTGLGWRF